MTDGDRPTTTHQYHSQRPRPRRATPDDGNWSIRCLDVHKRLGGVSVLNGLNVAFPDDTITVVLGPSGTGKSVLIKHIIGLMFPDSGDVIVQGTVGSEPDDARAAGAAAQDRRAVPGRRPVRLDVGVRQRRLPAAPAHRLLRGADRRARHASGWPTSGLADAMDDLPSQLSGGMRKRAGFARALVMEPDIVIFDEPDSGLDPVRTALLCELIQEMHAIYRGTYLVVTHNIASARQIGEYIALLWRGRIVEAGDARADVLLGEPVRAPVPERIGRGPADDGLTRRAAICEHTFVWSSACYLPRFELVAGRRRARRPADAGGARAGGGAAAWGPNSGVGEVSGAAEARGVARGMALGEALARCPELVLVPADPVRVAEAWEGSLRGPGVDRRGRRAGAPGARLLRDRRAARDPRHARRRRSRAARGALGASRAHRRGGRRASARWRPRWRCARAGRWCWRAGRPGAGSPAGRSSCSASGRRPRRWWSR